MTKFWNFYDFVFVKNTLTLPPGKIYWICEFPLRGSPSFCSADFCAIPRQLVSAPRHDTVSGTCTKSGKKFA